MSTDAICTCSHGLGVLRHADDCPVAIERRQPVALAAPTSPSEPVPSTPRVPGSTERPEGILAGLTVNERFYLAMHARYESQRQDDFRYQHADPAERERLRSRWSQIAAALEVEETNDGRE